MAWPRPLHDVTLSDVGSVGGKNASLGELLRELVPLGVRVPDGFAVTADAYRALMRESRAGVFVKEQLAGLSPSNVLELTQCSQRIRAAITRAPRPPRKTCQTRASPDAGQLPQRAWRRVRTRCRAQSLRQPLHPPGDPLPHRHGVRP